MPIRTADSCSRSSSRCLCRSEEHTSELQSQPNLVCRLLLEKKNIPGSSEPSGAVPVVLRASTEFRDDFVLQPPSGVNLVPHLVGHSAADICALTLLANWPAI